MGFTKPDLPAVDPDTFMQQPLMDRMKVLALHWAENGFGTPRMVHAIYIAKLLVFYVLGGVVVATTTSRLPAFWHVGQWWNQPVVYQKAVLWTVLLEAIGVAGSWGPLAGKFKPMTGGILFWARTGTIRLRPWRRVPFTAGDRRTPADVALYLALLVSVAVPLALPGVHSASLSAAVPGNTSGLVRPALIIGVIVLLVACGLRDKIIFLAARGEQYLPALIFFAVLPFTDMIIALKLLIVAVWIGAGFSKLGKHFANVVPPMVSNSPGVPFQWIKRAHYRDFPRDIRPSRLAHLMAHGGGTFVEIITPLVLLLSPWRPLTLVAVGVMVLFHLFIISTFPLAVPLEWNVLFGYAAVFLFAGFPAGSGYAVTDMSAPWLIVVRRGRAAVLPGARQPAPGPGVVPALAAPVRRQLGLRGVGVRAGRRGQAQRGQAAYRQPGRPAGGVRLRAQVGGRDHAAGDRLADHAQPGPRAVLAAVAAPARHRCQDRAGGRVRVQLAGRVQLRRRAPAQRGHDRRRAGPGRLRAGRAGRGLGGIPAGAPRLPGIPADRRGPRRHRARPLAGRRRGGRAAMAAQRADPGAGNLVPRSRTATLGPQDEVSA